MIGASSNLERKPLLGRFGVRKNIVTKNNEGDIEPHGFNLNPLSHFEP